MEKITEILGGSTVVMETPLVSRTVQIYCLVVGPALWKYTSESQLGWWMTPNISWENKIDGNQPTNQYMLDVLESSWINFEIESLAVSRLRVGRPSRPKRAEKEIYLHDPVGPLVCGRGKSRKGNTAWWVSTNGIIGSFSIIFGNLSRFLLGRAFHLDIYYVCDSAPLNFKQYQSSCVLILLNDMSSSVPPVSFSYETFPMYPFKTQDDNPQRSINPYTLRKSNLAVENPPFTIIDLWMNFPNNYFTSSDPHRDILSLS